MKFLQLNLPFVSRKIETIDFKVFLKGEQSKNTLRTQNYAFSLAVIPFNPSALIDPVFLSIAVGIFVVALFEKGFADNGNIFIAEAIYSFLKIAFPIVGFAAIYFLISHLTFLGW